MKAVLFGATGMVGQGVLRECLLDPDVEGVLAIVRNSSLPQHDKLREIVHQDVSDLSAIEDRLSGCDACFFCLGVSAVGIKEEAYRRLTYDLTVSVARTLAARGTIARFAAPRLVPEIAPISTRAEFE